MAFNFRLRHLPPSKDFLIAALFQGVVAVVALATWRLIGPARIAGLGSRLFIGVTYRSPVRQIIKGDYE